MKYFFTKAHYGNRSSIVQNSMFLLLASSGLLSARADEVDFGRDVLPILSENCFHCHGPDQSRREADLRLDTASGAKRDLGGYNAIKAGDPDQSELILRIASADPEVLMPPPDSGKGALSKQQISTLRQWIQTGAEYQRHWSFQPVRDVEPPAMDAPELTSIDRFVVDKLRNNKLVLSKAASRQQLIRRATFDLTGLPPKWSDVEAFVNDSSPDSFEVVINRLLDSPQYGERWGRHWLDLARYADTHGGSAFGAKRFPFSYTYRDYVIQAFNKDLPYDQFILEQVAADQLGLKENDPALAALGFLTVGRRYRNPHDQIDDQIDVISRGLQGLTVACARCHDHKFDPIPTTDYYALHSILSNSDTPRMLPILGSPEISEGYLNELSKNEVLRDDIMREQSEILSGRLRMQVGIYLGELARGTPEQDTTSMLLVYRTDSMRPIILERWRKYLNDLDDSDPVFGPWKQLARLKKDAYAKECQSLIEAMVKENGEPEKFKDEHLFKTKPPRWNPRVLEALLASKPQSFIEVAETYGQVFTDSHRKWLQSKLEAALEASAGNQVIPDESPKHRTITSSIERQLRHHLYAPESPTTVTLETRKEQRLVNRGVQDHVMGTVGAIENLGFREDSPSRAMALQEKSDPQESFVFVRGNPINRGERVNARYLTIFADEDTLPFQNGQQRLGLAKAIVEPSNPLTSRVVVNWVWQHHFGRGLVRTPDNFGTRGDPPTHPQLLDHLAKTFQTDGWSLKKLHRRIMLSAVYQQDSLELASARTKDPANKLLWRMPPRKLEMEAMRDSMLAVSGELQQKIGGRPFEEKEQQTIPRRSVYGFVNRDSVSPMASTFDGANPSTCTVKRTQTMVPQQTLFALNSKFIQDRAAAIVLLPEVQSAETDEGRVSIIYRLVYSREPEPEEVRLAIQYLKAPQTEAWRQLTHVLLASNEFHFVD